MKFNEVSHRGSVIGYSSVVNKDLFFFGTANTAVSTLAIIYPDIKFCRLKQVHGDALVFAQENIQPADAHWTDQTYIAPLIATADCVPVLISHNDFICTVHAGWRGVANGILCKSLLALKIKHPEFQSLRVVLGPHIQHSSFEVNSSLAINFQEQFYKLGGQDQVWTKHPTDPEKGFVNLAKILRQQLASLDIPEKSIFEFSVDTKTDPRFSSFRREKEKSGRNLSFVSRLSS